MTVKELLKRIAADLIDDGVTPTTLFNDDIYERVNYLLEKEKFYDLLEKEVINQFQNDDYLKEKYKELF